MAKVVFLNDAQAEMLSEIFENEGAMVLVWPQTVSMTEGKKLIEFAESDNYDFGDPDVVVELVGDKNHPFVGMALDPCTLCEAETCIGCPHNKPGAR